MVINSPVLFLIIALINLLTIVHAEKLCNGYAEYCDKPYNTLTYVLTHNSYAFITSPASNQMCPITTQLSDGVRGLKLSAINPMKTEPRKNTTSNSIYLCHTSCALLNAGSAVQTLRNITEWLRNNPNEVLTISWNNLGGFQTDAFEAAYNASGILEYTYAQPIGNYTWPTLQEMIDSGKRVVNFVDEGADQTTLPWLMDEFKYVFETPYDTRNETEFRCVIDRPLYPDNPDQMMYVMNHFLYGAFSIGSMLIEIPQMATSNVTNAESLLNQAKTCTATFGRKPNFLEVDFYNLGTTLEIAAQLNGVAFKNPSSSPSSLLSQCNNYVTSANAALKKQQKSSATHHSVKITVVFYFCLLTVSLIIVF